MFSNWQWRQGKVAGLSFCSGLTHGLWSGVNLGQEDPSKLWGVYVDGGHPDTHYRFSSEGESIRVEKRTSKGMEHVKTFSKAEAEEAFPSWAELKPFA